MNPLRDVRAALGTLRPVDWSVVALSAVAAFGVVGVGVTAGWLSEAVIPPPAVAGPRPAPTPEQVELPHDPVVDLPNWVSRPGGPARTVKVYQAGGGSDTGGRSGALSDPPPTTQRADREPSPQPVQPPREEPPPRGDNPPPGDPPGDEPLLEACINPVVCVAADVDLKVREEPVG